MQGCWRCYAMLYSRAARVSSTSADQMAPMASETLGAWGEGMREEAGGRRERVVRVDCRRDQGEVLVVCHVRVQVGCYPGGGGKRGYSRTSAGADSGSGGE